MATHQSVTASHHWHINDGSSAVMFRTLRSGSVPVDRSSTSRKSDLFVPIHAMEWRMRARCSIGVRGCDGKQPLRPCDCAGPECGSHRRRQQNSLPFGVGDARRRSARPLRTPALRRPANELITFKMSAVAVCCSSASRNSLSSRVFSMAMTAWAAKFCTRAICFSVNGALPADKCR